MLRKIQNDNESEDKISQFELSNNRYSSNRLPTNYNIEKNANNNPTAQNQTPKENSRYQINKLAQSLDKPSLTSIKPRNNTLLIDEKPDEKLKRQREQFNKQADFDSAFQYFQSQSFRKRQEDGTFQQIPLLDSLEKFKEFNLSTYLYLQFLRKTIYMMLILSLPSVVRMCIHYFLYDGFESTGLYSKNLMTSLQKLSVGNMNNPTLLHFVLSSTLDAFCMILVVGYCFYWAKFSRQTINQYTSDCPEPKHYTVYVDGFPELNTQDDLDMDMEEMKKMFKPQQIYEIVPVYNYNGKLQHFIDIEAIEEEIRSLEVTQPENYEIKRSSLLSKKSKLEEQLSEDVSLYPLKGLFTIIHFQKIQYKWDFLNNYLPNFHTEGLLNRMLRFITRREVPSRSRYRQSHPLMIRNYRVTNPDDICWENSEITNPNRLMRIILGVLAIPFVTIAFAFAISCCSILFVASSINCNLYSSPIKQSTVLSGFTDSNLVYCYCSENFPSFNDICINKSTYTRDLLFSTVLTTLGALVSAISNTVLTGVVQLMVKFMRFQRKSTTKNLVFWLTLITNLFNSLLTPLVLSLHISDFKPASLLAYFLSTNSNSNISYSDFERGWYIYVSPYYLNYLLIGATNPIGFVIITIIVNAIKRWYLKKRAPTMLQGELVNKLCDYEFNVESNTSLIIVYLFVIVMYSAQSPLYILLGLGFFFLNYWCHRILITKYSLAGVSAMNEFNSKILKVVPVMLIIHFGFALWSYTVPEIFTDSSLYSSISLFTTFSQNTYFLRTFMVPYFTVLLAVVLIYVLIDVLLYEPYIWFRNICSCCPKVKDADEGMTYEERLKNWFQKKENDVTPTTSYQLSKNKDYFKISQRIQLYLQQRKKVTAEDFSKREQQVKEQLMVDHKLFDGFVGMKSTGITNYIKGIKESQSTMFTRLT